MRLYFLLVLVLLAAAARAQVPDTTSAWRYFPLAVGNVWEYELTQYLYQNTFGHFRRTVTGDTIIDGRLYFESFEEWFYGDDEPDYSWTLLLRYDTLAAVVMVRADAGDEWPLTPCPLDAPFGSQVYCEPFWWDVFGGYGSAVSIGHSTVFTSAKWYEPERSDSYRHYAAAIGELGSWYYDPLFEDSSKELIYARVGGVEYGTPFVAAEPPPEAPSALRLTVSPNPVRSAGTVALVLDRPQPLAVSVHDVLGREVAVLAEGFRAAGRHALPLDGSALPPGIYVVRATAGGTAVAHSVSILR
jgi:hypothetical protein